MERSFFTENPSIYWKKKELLEQKLKHWFHGHSSLREVVETRLEVQKNSYLHCHSNGTEETKIWEERRESQYQAYELSLG